MGCAATQLTISDGVFDQRSPRVEPTRSWSDLVTGPTAHLASTGNQSPVRKRRRRDHSAGALRRRRPHPLGIVAAREIPEQAFD